MAVWSRTDPEEAARWLAEKNVQVSGQGLNDLARRWGQSDFEAASAFAETLTDRKRALFLTGLSSATERWSKEELLAWVSRYEGEPAYPHLMVSVVQRFAQEDVGAAIELIETLPEQARLASYRSVVPSLAFRNPEAAVALIDKIGNESVRDELVPVVARMLGAKRCRVRVGLGTRPLTWPDTRSGHQLDRILSSGFRHGLRHRSRHRS